MQIIDSALDPVEYQQVRSALDRCWLRSARLWQDNRRYWNPDLVQGFTGSVLVASASGAVASVMRAAVNRYRPIRADRTVTVQYTAWLRDSGILVHRDSRYYRAATLYMNDSWTAEQGGLFLYSADQRVLPLANRLIINDNQLFHQVTRVCTDQPRFTVQVWVH